MRKQMRNKPWLTGAVLLVLATMSVSAADARYQAMGGAFTAIGDDANTITANPAGLGFLRDSTATFASTFSLHPTFSAFTYEEDSVDALGGVSPFDLRYSRPHGNQSAPVSYVYHYDYDSDDSDYYIDDTDTTFDAALGDLDFDTDGDDQISEAEFDDMQSWAGTVALFDIIASHFNSISFESDTSFIDRNIGFSYQKALSAAGSPESTDPENLTLISQNTYSGALAHQMGNLSVGASATYASVRTITRDTPQFADYEASCEEFQEFFNTDDPDEMGMMMIDGRLFDDAQKRTSFSLGAGAMVSMGSLTAGAAVQDLIPLVFSEQEITDSRRWIGEHLNVGIAYESNRKKVDHSDDLINLLLAADVKQAGSREHRTLHLGAELGLSLAEFITADVRAGYMQELGQSFEEILDGDLWDPESGILSVGMGAKVFMARLDMALSLPAVFFQELLMHGDVDEDFIAGRPATAGPQFTMTGSIVF
jgi:hypothetical protein